jgi:hypothetical protein
VTTPASSAAQVAPHASIQGPSPDSDFDGGELNGRGRRHCTSRKERLGWIPAGSKILLLLQERRNPEPVFLSQEQQRHRI